MCRTPRPSLLLCLGLVILCSGRTLTSQATPSSTAPSPRHQQDVKTKPDNNHRISATDHNKPVPDKPVPDKPPVPVNNPGQNGWSIVPSVEQLRFPSDSVLSFYVNIPRSSAPGASADAAGNPQDSASGAPQLTLVASSLQDPDSKLSLPAESLYLCGVGKKVTDDGCKRSGIAVLDRNARLTPLKLIVDPAFSKNGTFSGNVSFKLNDHPEVQVLKLTVYSRSTCSMWIGAGLIVLGLLLYLFVTVFLRQSIAISTAQLAASELNDTIATLGAKLQTVQRQTSVNLPGLTNALKAEASQITAVAIKPKLPSLLANPFVSGADAASQFSSYITPVSDRVAAYVVLIDNGLTFATAAFSSKPVPSKMALESIDGLSVAVKNADDARIKLAPILEALHSALVQTSGLQPQVQAASISVMRASLFARGVDSTSIRMHLEAAVGILWLFWTLVATIGGFASLILANYGFGSGSDYLKCLLWGLGFSVAGSQLQSLTQSSVSTTIGISVPKSKTN